MDEKKLDEVLGGIRGKQMPALPSGFSEGVWREIRRREGSVRQPGNRWWEELAQLLFRPPVTAAAFLLALGLGAATGTVMVRADDGDRARDVLEMSIFGSRPPGLPSTLLFHNRN